MQHVDACVGAVGFAMQEQLTTMEATAHVVEGLMCPVRAVAT